MNLTQFAGKAKRWTLSILIPAFALNGQPLRANPSGGVVVHGQASINHINANHLQINQTSQSAVINWTDFSIGAGQLTQFVQPGVNAAVLNRVTGGNVSQIHGMLQANGSVFVVNTNGIVIGAGGVIDVGGMTVLSTLDIDDQDFLDGGPSRFYGDTDTGVTNFGTISSAEGDVVLLGGFVDNQGQIGALNGTVALASGGDILLEQSNGMQVTVRGSSDYTGTGVNNDGVVQGAAVEMKAHGNVYALAINNGNMVRATGASRANGRVRLMASGGSSNINLGQGSNIYARNGSSGGEVQVASSGGNVAVNGTIDASGPAAGGSVDISGQNVTTAAGSSIDVSGLTSGGFAAIDAENDTVVEGSVTAVGRMESGGNVEITGDVVRIGSGADISANGASAGGRVRIGGEFQGRDSDLREATSTVVEAGAQIGADSNWGSAGSVVVWANEDTLFRGEISASALGAEGDGGLIEVSGKEELSVTGVFQATSVGGRAGTVLFDPGTLTVGNFGNNPGANEIEIGLINNTLEGGTSVILMTEGLGSNIIFRDEGRGGDDRGGTVVDTTTFLTDLQSDRHQSIQWTNSDASFGAFAGGSIIVENHIRTSGAGSINLIAGWTGSEADFQAGGIFESFGGNALPAGAANTASATPPSVQSIFESYVANGQFGQNFGIIQIGNDSMNRHVEVGSRFGETNVAAASVTLTASEDNTNPENYAHLGFRDSGVVFAPRLNLGGSTFDAVGIGDRQKNASEDIIVGIRDEQYEVDRNGDGVVDGVYLVDSSGVLDGQGGRDEAFIPYAIHYNSARSGNWWWQQIYERRLADATAIGGATQAAVEADMGGLIPEMGAGTASNFANINVISTGDVILNGGGRQENAAQIGHGGDSASFLSARSYLDTNANNVDTDISLGTDNVNRAWSINGAVNDRSSTAIGRLAPVYGDITVLAGVNSASGSVSFNSDGTVNTAVVDSGGNVRLLGTQRFEASNQLANPESNAGTGAAVQIGHGGVGQFGLFNGDIRVEADGDVEVRAGSHRASHAAIGHTINWYHYWNPSSNPNGQIRFFRNRAVHDATVVGEYGNVGEASINRRGELFSGGPETVDAMVGSAVNGFHGDVTVRANSGEVLLKGFDTPDRSDPNDLVTTPGINALRTARFAQIGHGGYTQFERDETGGERVALEISATDSGAQDVVGNLSGNSLFIDRGLTFLNITGDIQVSAATDISLRSGNGTSDYAQIGHGGHFLADEETSGILAGNITLSAGRDLTLLGGGEIAPTSGSNRFGRNNAMVGHGGYASGFLGQVGDITVTADGNITMTAGGEQDTFAKIGHHGSGNDTSNGNARGGVFSQSGGLFNRTENFLFDGVSTDLETDVTATNVKRTIGGVERNFAITTNTADISVVAQGAITMNHVGEGAERTGNQPDTGTTFTRVGNSFVQIGHGGIQSTAVRLDNPDYQFLDKVGDITVRALGGNLDMQNGNGRQRWTRIGHGLGVPMRDNELTIQTSGGFQQSRGSLIDGSAILAGNITVESSGNVLVNAAAASAYGRPGNGSTGDPTDNAVLIGDASDLNPVVIGHGAILGTDGLIVVSDGSFVNGIEAVSDIEVTAAGNLEIRGGEGFRGSFAQVGHGYGDLDGNSNNNTRNGQRDGFSGNINVNVGGNIDVIAGIRPWVVTDATINSTLVPRSVVGSHAAIGHGGYGIDAIGDGDISVYAGGNLNLTAQQRQTGVTLLPTADGQQSSILDTFTPPTNTAEVPEARVIASVYSLSKIGHFSVENSASNGGNGDAVINSSKSGDIDVVVAQDIVLTAGTTDDEELGPILGAFSQIGHGGPGMAGDLEGDITVLAGNDITATGGTLAEITNTGLQNYAMIGHGDRVFEAGTGEAVISGEGLGTRSGDIVVAAGEDANFTDVLIGHADPLNSIQAVSGNTTIAVSRNDPFFGGSGVLTTGRSSGFYSSTDGTKVYGDTAFAAGGDLSIFMPGRSSNAVSNETRLNEGSSFTLNNFSMTNFAGLDGSGSATSGEAFEVYLTPDLWWDQGGIGIASGFPDSGTFPTDATSGEGGAIARVASPGGFENLTTLTAGAIGSSATLTSGGDFTLYFDAVEAVSATQVILPPPPIVIPPTFPPFTFIDFVFQDQFDSFERYQEFLESGTTGIDSGLFSTLSPEDLVEEEVGAGGSRLENGLDNAFGPRKNSFSAAEVEEERRRIRRNLAEGIGVGGGLTFYTFDPGTNQYSSYQVFGIPTGLVE